jgi:hypothetical protein
MKTMRFFTDPNHVVMDFDCPYCHKSSSITVHEDGSTFTSCCGVEAHPPLTYNEAFQQEYGIDRNKVTYS